VSQKICLVIALLVIPSFAWAWDGKRDNKPIAELELMNDKELAFEALDVCLTAQWSQSNLNLVIAAGDYLALIGRIFRKRLNHELESMTDMIAAALGRGAYDCKKAFNKLHTEISKKPPPRGK